MIIALLIIIILALTIYAIKLHYHQEQVIKVNVAQKAQNELIAAANENLKSKQEEIRQQLEETKNQVDEETEKLASLVSQNNKLRDEADKKAKEFYETRINELKDKMQKNLEALEQDYETQKGIYLDKLEQQKAELHDIEQKQEAYLQAQQRQAAIDANQDYYRLAIDEVDLNDIELLRELQKRFFKKEVIDKVIWENYYKPAYNVLMSHLFDTKNKVSGIYKLTDLTTGQSYIGQSVDCKERMRQHIKTGLTYGTATNKLYQAMKKSRPHNFIFELLEEVPKDKLNEREVYWIEFYKTKGQLNGTKGGS